ncbi:Co/Zn/Cd efflux system component [Povalibacter uvarum]|uniref:Co/Zn/Cd efflux system component n=2 Tax=Povalibacter uvarum TaxID=732238 RepID=A0A841HNV0_9GAMM|nr:Co/Zn/Cd efflux system component [Povalibacter uvarum]
MFLVEIVASHRAQSASLLADAVDFLGDAGNYAVSLFALSMGALWRARTALLKGLTMGAFGLLVLGRAAWGALSDFTPHPATMGFVGLLALAVNVLVTVLLYKYREGDANMRSVWLCSRNDAIGNLAVIAAAVSVSLTQSAWPDLLVALLMGALAIAAGKVVIVQARQEIVEVRAHDIRDRETRRDARRVHT